jgi:hypothetical protein
MAKKRTDPSVIVQKAEELARSGEYQNWLSIEFALRSQGLSGARDALDRDWVRERLDDLCGQARQKRQ